MGFRSRIAPPDLVRTLREIVPDADLIYLGDGRWQLGYYKPENSRVRTEVARSSLGMLLEAPDTEERNRQVAFLRFIARTGFRIMGNPFDVAMPETAGIPETLRRWDWIYRHRADEAWRERLDEIDDERSLERAAALMAEKVDGDGRSIFRHVTAPTIYSTP